MSLADLTATMMHGDGSIWAENIDQRTSARGIGIAMPVSQRDGASTCESPTQKSMVNSKAFYVSHPIVERKKGTLLIESLLMLIQETPTCPNASAISRAFTIAA